MVRPLAFHLFSHNLSLYIRGTVTWFCHSRTVSANTAEGEPLAVMQGYLQRRVQSIQIGKLETPCLDLASFICMRSAFVQAIACCERLSY